VYYKGQSLDIYHEEQLISKLYDTCAIVQFTYMWVAN